MIRRSKPRAGGASAVVLLAIFAPLSTGCRNATPESRPVTVTDSAGVRIVSNGPAGALPVVSVDDRPVFRVGWKPGEAEFESVRSGALLDDGSVVVFDEGAKQLVAISVEGEILRRIGREGEGPGEFRDGRGVEALPGDTLLVYDDTAGRLSLFDPGGSFVDSGPWPGAGQVKTSLSSLLSTGRVAWIPSSVSFLEGQVEGGWIEGPLVTSSRLGRDRDTVRFVPFVEARLDNAGPVSDPFVRFGSGAAYPLGFVWARNDLAEVRWFSPDGDLRQVARWDARRVEVDDDVWERYESVSRQRAARDPEGEALERFERDLRERREVASPFLPHFRWVHTAPDGDVWLSEYTMRAVPAHSFLVIGSSGESRGQVDFPRPIRILEVGRRRVLGVEMDDLDVEAVVVYEVGL